MEDFQILKEQATKGLQILIDYHDCFAWLEFGDRGNGCYDPFAYASQLEIETESLWLAAVRSAMPQYSSKHAILAWLVARDVDNQWVTYGWLIKSMARILSGQSLEEIVGMCVLSRTVREKMREKGIIRIDSLESLFA